MRFAPVLLQMCALALTVCAAVRTGQESFRIVVTFQTAKDNNIVGIDLGGARVVKQYGRRLVLDLGQPFDLEVQRLFFMAKLKSVQSVEIDALVGLQQLDISQIITADTLDVTKLDVNATGPDVDATYVSSAGQTPLWNLMDSEPYSIHAEGVWQVTNSTPDVVVAVLDTGMAVPARGMFLNLLEGYDFISDEWLSLDGDERDPDATDPGDWGDTCPTPSWHGTKVASILAARHDNEWGMKGVAQNCSVMPVRVLGLCRMGYASDVSDAVVWAAGGVVIGVPNNTNPAKIISLSLAGKGSCPDYFQSAVNHAVALGAIIVAAAGNNNQDAAGYFPSNCVGVISVAAITRSGTLAAYSNWGASIVVSAPGGDSSNAIVSLGVNPLESGVELTYGIGTSFAAPQISGVGALIGVTFLTRLLESWKEFTSLNTNTSYNVCTNEACSAGIISGKMSNFSGVFATATCSNTNSMGICGVIGQFYSCGACTCPSNYYYNSNYDGLQYYTEGCYSCASCTANQYLSNCGSMGAGSCIGCACSAGYYISGCGGTTAGSCPACPPSSYCLGGLSQPAGWKASCGAGTYQTTAPTASVDRVCSSCTTSGYYCAGGITAQVQCALGYYCASTSTQVACVAPNYCPAGSIASTACPIGNYCTDPSTKISCTSGYYCPAGVTAQVQCALGYYCATPSTQVACVAPNYCPAGSIVSTPCSAGYYCPNPSTKTPCPVGSYCPAGQTTPTPCPAGTKGVAMVPGASNVTDCVTCPAGTYSTAGSNACSSCSAFPNTFSTGGAASCTTCTVLTCVNQYKVDCKLTSDTTCQSCSVTPGPSGAPPPNANFVSLTDPACAWTCNIGYYLNTTTKLCVACTQNSIGCSSGQYRQKCVDAGTSDGVCVSCTNAPVNSNYTGVSTTGGVANDGGTCPFDCKAPYSKQLDSTLCCPVCTNGNYNSGCSKSSSGSCATCSN